MLRSWSCLSKLIGCLICVVAGGLRAEDGRLSEALLPDTTQGFLAISNVDTLTEHWNKTQLGHLMADPVMEPFTKDLHRQFEDRWSSIHERLGLTLDDMKGVPGGDVAIGLIAPAPGKAAIAIVVDVTGKLAEAQELLQKTTAAQLQRGATRHEVKVNSCPDTVIQFDLPETTELQEAGRSTLKGSAKSEGAKSEAAKTGNEGKATDRPAAQQGRPVRKAFYCLTGNLLVVTDSLQIMEGILDRAMGHPGGSLADHRPYQIVSQRCRRDAPEEAPQIRWFIHPLGYAEAARAATPPENRRKGKSILETMRNQGVGGVHGAGGLLDFSSEGYEMIHRTAVYAPEPREKAMKMLVLPNETEFAPQPWVPRDIATYITLYADILNAFDNFDSLFDELVGGGEPGAWKDTLAGLSKDPNGPQVDLRSDLIKHLGRRVSILTDYQLPITTSSERLLFAIETNDAQAVAEAIEKCMQDGAKRRDVDGQIIWEYVEDEVPEIEAPQISFGDDSAASPVPPKQASEDEEEEEAPRLLPHMAVTVWKDHLFIASHIDILLKVIHPDSEPEPLLGDVDYQLVNAEVEKMTPDERCARVFSRTDEAYRPTYELIRQNKMPESESMLARLLKALFGEGKKGVPRHQKLDGSQLPEYQVVRRYLGPAGFQATTEPDGWFLKGFTLSKEAE